MATDAGREGELIFRYIYNYLGCPKPFLRLWISSLTDQAIRNGLENLEDGRKYDDLYYSAKARSEADWLVGINSSQALCLAVGKGNFSLGRVQTPTLAMICNRYHENKNFSSQKYYKLKVETEKNDTSFSVISVDKFTDKSEAENVLTKVVSTKEMKVLHIEKKEATQEPPLLYDLTTLQKEMNRRYGFSADKTLSVAQKLYESKLITYPRTGSRYISEDLYDEIYYLISMYWEHPVFGSQAIAVSNSEINRRSIDDKKVTDHHALLYTRNIPTNLSQDESYIYEHIVGRVIEAFSKACIKRNTTIQLECTGTLFEVKGSRIIRPGWKKVLGEPEDKDENEVTKLPVLSENEILLIQGAEVMEKQTKPRPLHTESSLLSAMETAGRELEDEAEKAALKDTGIGTPATRAAIIETLLTRDYIRREKKNLVPTDKGLSVYEIVKNKKIANVAMTGSWENALSKIGSGEMDALSFRKGIEVYTTQITSELLETTISFSDEETVCCPKCNTGQLRFYPKVVKCLSDGCGLIIYRSKNDKQLTDKHIKDLVIKRRTGVIKGFKKKDGSTFDAALVLDSDFKVTFDFTANSGKQNKKK